MTTRAYAFLAALIGVMCGFLTIHSFFVHSWTSILFWVATGSAILYFSPSRKAALYAGTCFGFFTILMWLISGFQGTSSQVFGFSIMVVALSILGALCGFVGALITSKFVRRI